MASSPLAAATLQCVALGAFSNVLAQIITAYRANVSLSLDTIDWVPVLQFALFNMICTPPNFLWQDFLESTFPAHPAPTPSPKKSTEKTTKSQPQPAPKLSIRNTLIKFFLDQTFGAAVNTLLFSFFTHSLQAAMLDAPRVTSIFKAISYWTAPSTIDLSRVNFDTVLAASMEDFWPIVVAGWKLWPAVSLVNFTLVKTVEGRNLVGSLAGVVWGVYMSLIAAK